MSDFLDIFIFGILDAFGPYALASLALSFSFFVLLRKNPFLRRVFIWCFTSAFLLFSFLFFWGVAQWLFEDFWLAFISRATSMLVCGGLIFYSVLFVFRWCGLNAIGSRRDYVLLAMPLTGCPPVFVALAAVVIALLWAMTAAVWPPSYPVSALALNVVLPGRAVSIFFALFVYQLFKCFLLIALPFAGESLLVMAERPQGLGRYHSLLVAASAAFLGAVGIGLFFLL